MTTLVLASHTSNVGGAETSLLDLAAALIDEGIDARITLPSATGGLATAARRRGVETEVLPSSWSFSGLGPDGFGDDERNDVLLWSDFLTDVGPDAVISNTLTMAAPLSAAQSLGIANYVWVHGVIPTPTLLSVSAPVAAWRRRERMLLDSVDGVAFCSPMAAESFGPVIPPSTVIRNPIPLAEPVPQLTDRPVFLHVGIVEPNKNQMLAVEALAALLPSIPQARVIFCGLDTSPYAHLVKRRAAELGIEGSVTFAGHVSEVHELRRNSLATLVTSRQESASRAALESLAMAVPVITTDSIGPRDFIESDVSGGVMVEDRPICLADAMHRLWSDRTHAEALGRAGRATVETRHAPERIAAAWWELVARGPAAVRRPMTPDFPARGAYSSVSAAATPVAQEPWLSTDAAETTLTSRLVGGGARWDLPIRHDRMRVVVAATDAGSSAVRFSVLDDRLPQRPLRTETLTIDPSGPLVVTVTLPSAPGHARALTLRVASTDGRSIAVSPVPDA